ncbi:MAG: hypothetical protein L0212_00375 [Acidobacteria bacterium]|nr:hypothetical protein [Acidobacteriota bacterium]
MFEYINVLEWPPLAWVARCPKSGSTITVFHGRQVETTPDWFCEAIWDGPYEEGGFDSADSVAGTGGRLRDGGVVFVVSSGDFDRLHSVLAGDVLWVSNSLPGLLATSGATVDACYGDYWRNLFSIICDHERYERYLAASQPPVRLTYKDNLSWNGSRVEEWGKAHRPVALKSFVDFRKCLDRILGAVTANLASLVRKYPYPMIGTISSGYDAAAVCALLRDLGLRDAITFGRTRDGQDDSGARTAEALGLGIHVVDGDAWREIPFSEVPFLAVNGHGQNVQFRGAEELLCGRAVFTGAGGDIAWSKGTTQLDTTPLSMSEYRLWAGYIQCPVPYWLKRFGSDLLAIGESPEMREWDRPGDYSRPVPWRILREAGVPAELWPRVKRFAARSVVRAGSSIGPVSHTDYLRWLRSRAMDFIRRGRVPPLAFETVDRAVLLMYGAVEHFGSRLRDWSKEQPVVWRIAVPLADIHNLTFGPRYVRRYLFAWAVERAQKRYKRPW